MSGRSSASLEGERILFVSRDVAVSGRSSAYSETRTDGYRKTISDKVVAVSGRSSATEITKDNKVAVSGRSSAEIDPKATKPSPAYNSSCNSLASKLGNFPMHCKANEQANMCIPCDPDEQANAKGTMFWQSVEDLEKQKQQQQQQQQQRQQQQKVRGKTRALRARRTYKPLSMYILSRENDRDFEEDMSINALGSPAEGATLVEAVLDSGAVDSVANDKVFKGAIKPSKMSKEGKKYRGPDGSRIPNLGQKNVVFASDEGHKCGLTFQIADVERPLIAASHLTEAGNKVSLWKTGGEVMNIATGKKIKVQRRGGIYVLRMWIPPEAKSNAASAANASVFPRQGS